jgi:NAD-dependent dihydropyrimidine dehydrogenase PreA subunit
MAVLASDSDRAAPAPAGNVQHSEGDVPESAMSADQIEETGRITAPFVDASACTGCGQCEYRCRIVNVEHEKLLDASAVVVRKACV